MADTEENPVVRMRFWDRVFVTMSWVVLIVWLLLSSVSLYKERQALSALEVEIRALEETVRETEELVESARALEDEVDRAAPE